MQYIPNFEEIEPPKYTIGLPIDNNAIARNKENSHVVSYEFICVGDKQYDFEQKGFKDEDSYTYFNFMNRLSTDILETIYTTAEKDWHFHSTGNFKNKMFRKAVNK